jgi:hypothetical protein
MITQEMKNKGLSCKGKGLNCPTCLSKSICVEYVVGSRENILPISPPRGVAPKYIWMLQRADNLKRAIQEYTDVNLVVPVEWITEYNELVNDEALVGRKYVKDTE